VTETPAHLVSPLSREELSRELMRALRSAGTDLVFGVPGGGSNLEVVGAAEALGARFVLTHTETAAAIMAGVVGELTGSPGACVATRGPGAASAVNGAAQALLDRQPMLLITDCVVTAEQDRVSHQRLDQLALLGPVTKASLRCGPHDRDLPARAVALSVSGRPGPIHIELDPTAPAAGPPVAEALVATGDIDAARAALVAARRPVVIVGVGAVAVPAARRSAVHEALARFLDGTAVPALTTYKARGVVPDSGVHAAGVATGATIEAPLLEGADLIVGIGLDPVELIPAPWNYPAPVMLIGGWPIDDSTYFGDRLTLELVGDLAVMLGELAGCIDASWTAGEAAAHRNAALERVRAATPRAPRGLTPQEIVSIARAATPAGTIATVDAGAHMLVAVPLWEVDQPGELLISSGLATMGFALPAAIAASLAAPTRKVICFTGDGGVGMALAELETLARLGLDVVVVVFNDSTLSLIAIKQRPRGQGGDRAVRYAPIDFASVAEGCGLRAERVGDVAAYGRALRDALDRSGPTVLDVVVDPTGYPAVLEAIRGTRRAAVPVSP
jgi:acetolactate synthase-1/2/3 large subunit